MKKKVAKKKILAVLKKPEVGAINGELYADGSYCIVGGLLAAAGVSNAELLEGPDDVDTFVQRKPEWSRLLWKTYGLECDDLNKLMRANDSVSDGDPVEKRKDAIIEAIVRLPKEHSLVSETPKD